MSSTTKAVIAVVVVVLVAGGIWYYQSHNSGAWGTTAQGDDSTSLPSGSDTSDAALNQDMTSINANIQTVDSDSASADQSVDAAESGDSQ